MNPTLKALDISKTYHVPDPRRRFRTREVRALQEVSLSVAAGRTLGVVGESGCGKSTLARLLTLLEAPDRGGLWYDGRPLKTLRGAERKAFRRQVQIVFQDPFNALNPRMRVRDVLREPFLIHREAVQDDPEDVVNGLLAKTGLPRLLKERYPHELSGGERQRVCIARALALKPRIVVCDEAVSSLDVLIQAQILNLLLRLQREEGLGYVFISHDLGVVRHMSDEVIVMKDGRVVEEGVPEQIFNSPREAYTRDLLQASRLSLEG